LSSTAALFVAPTSRRWFCDECNPKKAGETPAAQLQFEIWDSAHIMPQEFWK